MREKDGASVGIGGLSIWAWRYASWRMESPLQEMDICSGPLTTFEPLRRLLYVSTAVVCRGAGQRKHELWMCSGRTVDAVVSFEGNYGAERQWVVCMAQAPDVFHLFVWQGGDFLKIEI